MVFYKYFFYFKGSHVEICKLLIENGADRNIKNMYDISPINIANKLKRYVEVCPKVCPKYVL